MKSTSSLIALFTAFSLVLVNKSNGFEVSSEFICTGEPVDIVFLLDSSNSIANRDFKKELKFVSYLVNNSDIGLGPEQVRVGVVVFGSRVYHSIKLKASVDRDSLNKKIMRINRAMQNTNTAEALRIMRVAAFQSKNGARPGVKRVAILLTDGFSTIPTATQKEAQACRDENIQIFVIGIGPKISYSELLGIASKPMEKFLFQPQNFEALKNIREKVTRRTCSKGCVHGIDDIFFLLDSSSSIGSEAFDQQRRIVETAINKFAISPEKTWVGAAMFSDIYHSVLDLNEGSDKTKALLAIQGMMYTGGATNLFHGLQVVNRKVFDPVSVRDGVDRYLIIFTDGMTIDFQKAADEAHVLQDSGVKIFVVMGDSPDVNLPEMKDIASKPSEKYIHNFTTFENLLSENACSDTEV